MVRRKTTSHSLAPPLPHQATRRQMTHVTAWLVALLLTGSPVAAGLCAAVCGQSSAPAAHCHHEFTQPAQAMSAETLCGSGIADAAYITDGTTVPHTTVLTAALMQAPGLAVTVGARPALTVPAAPGWLAPPLVLRV